METREVFWALETSQVVLFFVAGLAALAVFLWGMYRHLAKYRRGRPLVTPWDLRAGIGRMVSDVLSHRTLRRRDGYAGLAHGGIFSNHDPETSELGQLRTLATHRCHVCFQG